MQCPFLIITLIFQALQYTENQKCSIQLLSKFFFSFSCIIIDLHVSFSFYLSLLLFSLVFTLLHVLWGFSNFKDLGIHDGEDLCEAFNLDDIPLNFENGDEMLSNPQGASIYLFKDGGTDCLLMEKNLSVTESNCPIENAIEVIPILQSFCRRSHNHVFIAWRFSFLS